MKVQVSLSIFCIWEHTLAFIMDGAILLMALAWLCERGNSPVLAKNFSLNLEIQLNSVLFKDQFYLNWTVNYVAFARDPQSFLYEPVTFRIFIYCCHADWNDD